MSAFLLTGRANITDRPLAAFSALMSQAEQFADRIKKELPDVKKGTLRFWGIWSGTPRDNCHTLVRCDAEQDLRRLYFDGVKSSPFGPPGD